MADKTAKEVINEFHALAGEVAINWTELEDLVEATIWAIKGLNQQNGRQLTHDWRFLKQLEKIPVFLKERFPEKFATHSADWNTLVDKVDQLRLQRNAIVHGKWNGFDQYHDSPLVVGLKYESRGALAPKVVTYSYREIEKLSEAIVFVASELRYHIENNYEIYPAPYELSLAQMIEGTKSHTPKGDV